MGKVAWFLLGGVCVLVLEAAAGAVVISQARGWSALEAPTALESWLAHRAHRMAMPASAKTLANPMPNTPEVVAEGRAHWADHCAICHANDGSGSEMGKHMYPRAPDMRVEHMSDGELFYIIQNGVRLTGMPAWGGAGHSEDSWKLVRFIRHLPALTFEDRKEMEKLNPKGPGELQEEAEEEKFLKGEDSDAAPQHHHH